MLQTAVQQEMELLKNELDEIVSAYMAKMSALGRRQDDALKQFAHDLERMEVQRIKTSIRDKV